MEKLDAALDTVKAAGLRNDTPAVTVAKYLCQRLQVYMYTVCNTSVFVRFCVLCTDFILNLSFAL